MKLPLALFAIALAACATTPNDASTAPGATAEPTAMLPPDSNRIDEASAPTPFSAAEIQGACPTGATRTFRLTMGDKTVTQSMTFRDADALGTYVEGAVTGPNGVEINHSISAKITWAELQGHASFPRETTTITRRSAVVTAGSFDCWHYQTEDAAGLVSEYDFAIALPGPPIHMTMHRGGTLVQSMELLDWGPR